MDFAKTLLEQQPLMALFLTIAVGYFVGEMTLGGFSLGVGAVLFVALGMGWLVPKAVPAPMVGTLGLALFLYSVGVQYGNQFFVGLTSRAGLRANLLALTGVLAAGGVSLVIMRAMDLELGYALGRGHRVMVLAEEGTRNPFDIEPVPTHFWKSDSSASLREKQIALREYWQANARRRRIVEPDPLIP